METIRSDQVRKLAALVVEAVERDMFALENREGSRAFEFEPRYGELRYASGRSDIPEWRVELRITPIGSERVL